MLLLLYPMLLVVPERGREMCGYYWVGMIELILLCKFLDSL